MKKCTAFYINLSLILISFGLGSNLFAGTKVGENATDTTAKTAVQENVVESANEMHTREFDEIDFVKNRASLEQVRESLLEFCENKKNNGKEKKYKNRTIRIEVNKIKKTIESYESTKKSDDPKRDCLYFVKNHLKINGFAKLINVDTNVDHTDIDEKNDMIDNPVIVISKCGGQFIAEEKACNKLGVASGSELDTGGLSSLLYNLSFDKKNFLSNLISRKRCKKCFSNTYLKTYQELQNNSEKSRKKFNNKNKQIEQNILDYLSAKNSSKVLSQLVAHQEEVGDLEHLFKDSVNKNAGSISDQSMSCNNYNYIKESISASCKGKISKDTINKRLSFAFNKMTNSKLGNNKGRGLESLIVSNDISKNWIVEDNTLEKNFKLLNMNKRVNKTTSCEVKRSDYSDFLLNANSPSIHESESVFEMLSLLSKNNSFKERVRSISLNPETLSKLIAEIVDIENLFNADIGKVSKQDLEVREYFRLVYAEDTIPSKQAFIDSIQKTLKKSIKIDPRLNLILNNKDMFDLSIKNCNEDNIKNCISKNIDKEFFGKIKNNLIDKCNNIIKELSNNICIKNLKSIKLDGSKISSKEIQLASIDLLQKANEDTNGNQADIELGSIALAHSACGYLPESEEELTTPKITMMYPDTLVQYNNVGGKSSELVDNFQNAVNLNNFCNPQTLNLIEYNKNIDNVHDYRYQDEQVVIDPVDNKNDNEISLSSEGSAFRQNLFVQPVNEKVRSDEIKIFIESQGYIDPNWKKNDLLVSNSGLIDAWKSELKTTYCGDGWVATSEARGGCEPVNSQNKEICPEGAKFESLGYVYRCIDNTSNESVACGEKNEGDIYSGLINLVSEVKNISYEKTNPDEPICMVPVKCPEGFTRSDIDKSYSNGHAGTTSRCEFPKEKIENVCNGDDRLVQFFGRFFNCHSDLEQKSYCPSNARKVNDPSLKINSSDFGDIICEIPENFEYQAKRQERNFVNDNFGYCLISGQERVNGECIYQIPSVIAPDEGFDGAVVDESLIVCDGPECEEDEDTFTPMPTIPATSVTSETEDQIAEIQTVDPSDITAPNGVTSSGVIFTGPPVGTTYAVPSMGYEERPVDHDTVSSDTSNDIPEPKTSSSSSNHSTRTNIPSTVNNEITSNYTTPNTNSSTTPQYTAPQYSSPTTNSNGQTFDQATMDNYHQQVATLPVSEQQEMQDYIQEISDAQGNSNVSQKEFELNELLKKAQEEKSLVEKELAELKEKNEVEKLKKEVRELKKESGKTKDNNDIEKESEKSSPIMSSGDDDYIGEAGGYDATPTKQNQYSDNSYREIKRKEVNPGDKFSGGYIGKGSSRNSVISRAQRPGQQGQEIILDGVVTSNDFEAYKSEATNSEKQKTATSIVRTFIDKSEKDIFEHIVVNEKGEVEKVQVPVDGKLVDIDVKDLDDKTKKEIENIQNLQVKMDELEKKEEEKKEIERKHKLSLLKLELLNALEK